MICHDVDKIAETDTQRRYFKDMIVIALSIENMSDFDDFVCNMYIILSSKYHSTVVDHSMLFFKSRANKSQLHDAGEFTHIQSDIAIDENISCDVIYSSSPFYRRYFTLTQKIAIAYNTEAKTNEYFNEEMLRLILKKYIPYCPLWCKLTIGNGPLLSNAYVENYFGQLKQNSLDGKRNLKCSEFVRILRKDVLSLSRETDLKIPKSRLASTNEKTDEKYSQEVWNKRQKSRTSHFRGSYLKMAVEKFDGDEATNGEDCIFAEDDDFTQCIYCGHGSTHVTTKWIQCDLCKKWVHEFCLKLDETVDIEEIKFACNICTSKVSKPSYSTDIYQHCNTYLKSLKLSEAQISSIERDTRPQSNCSQWKEERKKRVTSSYFGRICKVRDAASFQNIIESITSCADVQIPATTHGRNFEKHAIELYEKISNVTCSRSGLVIHRQYPYLAASPDGLVGSDGIVEVKCPYNARNSDPHKYNFDFLNKNGESVRCVHNYYYQIQGILEVTDRTWCDLIIYTFKGIKVIRVNRNKKFWDMIIKKLRVFYLFHFLPSILGYDKLSSSQRKWITSEEIHFMSNGLVENIHFYRELPNKRGYVVVINADLNFSMKELLQDDFATLNHKQYLSSFVVDHCLHIINRSSGNSYQIISVAKASTIFSNKTLTSHFTDSITLSKDRIIMPILKNNHYTLMILSITNKTIIFIDPMGNEILFKNFYCERLSMFMKFKNIATSEFIFEAPNHIIQRDGYNCGVYVIHFFQGITKGIRLDRVADIDQQRINFKWMLLRNSADMTNIFLFCACSTAQANTDNVFICRTCKRHIHFKCLLTATKIQKKTSIDQKIANKMGDLCRSN
nr:unnamed protein product [Callosobruchus chinensis]